MNVCRTAWNSIREFPYNEDGVKKFEKIFNSMDSDVKIQMNVLEFKDSKLIVKFIYDESTYSIWEFYDGCEIIMCDSLCYEDEAKEFLELIKKDDG